MHEFDLRMRLRAKLRIDPETHIAIRRRTLTEKNEMHLHEFYELWLVLEGSGIQELNGTTYSMNPGTITFLTPIDFHSVTPEPTLKVLMVLFEESLLSPAMQMHFLNRRENLIFSSKEEVASLSVLVDRLENECNRNDAFAVRARKNLLELLLYPMARSITQSTELPRINSDSVEASLQYVFQHFREDITLAQVAQLCGYTANYFSMLFHKTCGTCFTDFLTRLRLNYARMLLLTTDRNISDIALASGFYSTSSFYRAFKKQINMSPAEYRSQGQ